MMIRYHSLLATLVLLFAGCDSQSDSDPDSDWMSDIDKFIGRWTYQAGSKVVVSCPGQPELSIPIESTGISVTRVSDRALRAVADPEGGGCMYDYAVAGDIASFIPGQRCTTIPDGRGGTLTESPSSGTLVTEDGQTMTDRASGDLGGCTDTTMGTLERAP
jgi:hypothetical protein